MYAVFHELCKMIVSNSVMKFWSQILHLAINNNFWFARFSGNTIFNW